MRREGKAGPFIPCEVQAQTRPARATKPTVARGRRRATTTVGTWAKALSLGRRHLCPGGNACALGTTSATWEGCFFTNTPNSGGRATMSTSGLQHLRLGHDVRARAMTSGACVHDQGWFCPSKLRI